MRGAQITFIILSLLALPLALLVRSGNPYSSCPCMCALLYNLHPPKPGQKFVMCGHCPNPQSCATKAEHQAPSLGLIALMAPTQPSAHAGLGIPHWVRFDFEPNAQFIPAGFVSLPFQPPRA